MLFRFQAEDGIRIWSVTGVQTCALFISSRRRHTRLVSDWSSDVCSSDLKQKTAYEIGSDWSSDVCSSDLEHTSELQVTDQSRMPSSAWSSDVCSRSEERRVGKEGRSRWSPYH